jgi:predicted transcriptional regulator
MEFRNLRRNILSRIGHKWLRSNGKKPIFLDGLLSAYNDIPEKEVEGAIQSLKENGSILISNENQSVRLTRKGLKQLQLVKKPNNNEAVVVAGKID